MKKVFIIREVCIVMDEPVEDIVAICKTHERAIEWLIQNKGLDENYSYSTFWDCTSLKEQYQENWKKAIIQNQWKTFYLGGCRYSIEEFEVF